MDWQLVAQLGSTAFVAIFAIGCFYKLATNHSQHELSARREETKVLQELVGEVKELRTDIKNSISNLFEIIKK